MNKNVLYFMPIMVLFSSFLLKFVKENQGPASYPCSDTSNIDSSLFEIRKGETYIHFNGLLNPKTLKDYEWLNADSSDYITAYLVNESDSMFKADMQDGSLIMIQEALDERGKWKPIEYWVHSGCGNSYSTLNLESGKYVLIPVKKFRGNIKTKFRLKMRRKIGHFYSDTFVGTINKNLFKRHKTEVSGILFDGPPSYLE